MRNEPALYKNTFYNKIKIHLFSTVFVAAFINLVYSSRKMYLASSLLLWYTEQPFEFLS